MSTLRGDLDRSVEVLQNLLENALKYGDGAWVKITFSDEENCRLITVSNSGFTLSESELAHIFDSFWRGSNAGNKAGSGLAPFISENGITALTYVPSLRSDIVPVFANKLAAKLRIPCLCLLKKASAQQQKEMENSSFQCENAQKSFSLSEGASVPDCVLLVDDMVDSKWTLTVCGDILVKAGAEHVYPFALATTSKKDILRHFPCKRQLLYRVHFRLIHTKDKEKRSHHRNTEREASSYVYGKARCRL